MRALKVKRGQIYYADLSPVIGSEQGGMRPVVIIQNDIGNIHSPTTIVACITSVQSKKKIPTHVEIPLIKDSIVLLEQLRTIDKRRLKNLIAEVDEKTLKAIDKAINISLGVGI
jgi:mRNA interferase MazF